VTRGRIRALVAGGVIGLLAVVGWCSRTPPPTVRTAVAAVGPLRVLVATNGVVEPIDDAEVRARVAGRVLFVPEPGTRVAAGEEIARIDAAPAAAELARARSERLAALEALRAARHEHEVVRDRFAADRTLFRERALTRERYVESEAARRDGEERVAALEAEVPLRVGALDLRIAELEEQTAAAAVRAPFAGTVYRTDVEEGQVVRVGDPVLGLANLEQLRVRTNVDQVDLGRVEPGQAVEVTANAFPGHTWKGRVTEVVPHVVEKGTRAVSEGLAELTPPTNGLVPGMTVDVDIVVAETAAALQVPSGAILVRGGTTYVFRVRGSRLELTPVTLGLESVGAAQVTAGLEAGDVVAVGATRNLADGMRIDAYREDA